MSNLHTITCEPIPILTEVEDVYLDQLPESRPAQGYLIHNSFVLFFSFVEIGV